MKRSEVTGDGKLDLKLNFSFLKFLTNFIKIMLTYSGLAGTFMCGGSLINNQWVTFIQTIFLISNFKNLLIDSDCCALR